MDGLEGLGMGDEKTAAEELAEIDLLMCPRAGLLICLESKCRSLGLVIKERKKVRAHVKDHHRRGLAVFNKCFDLAQSLLPSAVDVELRDKYMKGGAQHGVLPCIEGVPVSLGKKCFVCDNVFTNDETLRTHLGRMHPGHGKSAVDISRVEGRPCQSLLVRGGWFFVNEATSVGEREKLAVSVLEQYEPGAVAEAGDVEVQDMFVSPFVSAGRVQRRLRVSGLSLKQAGQIVDLYSPWYDEFLRGKVECVKVAIKSIVQDAEKEVSNGFETSRLMWVIQTPGMHVQDRGFEFLKVGQESGPAKEHTLPRYVNHTSLVVRMACVVVSRRAELPGVHMSKEVEEATKDVMEMDGNLDSKGFAVAVFKLLWVVFTERATTGGDKGVHGFAYAVVACCCVENDESGESLYSRGTSVGSKMCGILHAASCVFALYIVKYREEEKYEDARDRVKAVTSKDSLSAVHFFTDMRSITSSLREEEGKLNPFEKCRKHENCGIFAGVEMSAERLGEAVRAMHEKVEMKLFQRLMNGAELPVGFWGRVEEFVEDYDNKMVGFWAMSDMRNKELVQDSLRWACTAARVDSLQEYGWAGWIEQAEDVLLDLLTAMHISSGGPARGTEIGALTLRNTRFGRRTVFFPRGEVMTLPLYSKTRNMKRGKLIILSRHADKVTSRLLRSFFLLVYPLLVIEKEKELSKSANSGKNASLPGVRDLLTMGIWNAEDIATKIGGRLRDYGINLTFSQYRHLQRGIVKAKEESPHLRGVNDGEDAAMAEVERMENVEEDVHEARILQAGHSKNTAAVVYAQSVKGGKDAKLGTERNIDMFRQASEEWHKDLGLRSVGESTKKKEERKGQGAVQTGSGAPENVQGAAGGTVQASAALGGLFPGSSRLATLIAGKSEEEIIQCLEAHQSRGTTESDSVRRRSVDTANKVVSVEFGDTGEGKEDVVMESIPVEDGEMEAYGDKPEDRGSIGGSLDKSDATGTAVGVKRAGAVPSPDTLQSKSHKRRGPPQSTKGFFDKEKYRKSGTISQSDGRTQSSSFMMTASGTGGSFASTETKDTTGSGLVQPSRQGTCTRGVRKIVLKSFDALQALRDVTHKKANFKSSSQKRAMLSVVNRKHDVAAILPTGEGKTAVVIAPVKQEKGVTVWVVPLRALRWEMERRFSKANIQVRTLEDLDVKSDAKSCGVVLIVSPEEVLLDGFGNAMSELFEQGGLNRLVVDEAHLTVTASSYRGCMLLLRGATNFGTLCPIVMLTATAPPTLLQKIVKACGSDKDCLDIVISDPCRRNLSLKVVDLVDESQKTMIAGVVAAVKSQQNSIGADTGRMLVVCLTIQDSVHIHQALAEEFGKKDILLHHSNLRKQERSDVMRQWKCPINGVWRVIVATEGFSTGTDAPDVRLVLFAGAARNLVDFWQGAGRGGRDGKSGEVTVLFHRAHVERGNAGETGKLLCDEDVGDFAAWAEDKKTCRRAAIERWLIGKDSAPKCEDRWRGKNKVALCDTCEEERAKKQSEDENWALLNDWVSGSVAPTEIEIEWSVPSDAQTGAVEQRRHAIAKSCIDEIAYLRRAAGNLRLVCLDHVLTFYGKGTGRVNFPAETVTEMLKCSMCKGLGGFCPIGNRCLRCQESRCTTTKCKTFFSIHLNRKTGKKTGNGRCQQCRLVGLMGKTTHEENEFGSKLYCHVQHCLNLLMRAWNVVEIRKHMFSGSGGVAWGPGRTPKDRKEYGEWLTFDEVGAPAGICTALHWLFDNMPFDLGKMDLSIRRDREYC